jgi:hypothetical protein
MANLAATYRNQNRWKEAGELELEVIEMKKKVLGVEHPDTLVSMNNLAHTWKTQGKYAEALALMEECVQIRSRVLGINHPKTHSSLASWNSWKTLG